MLGVGEDEGGKSLDHPLVPFPLEYALYQIPVSPARRSRAGWNPQLEVTFQYRQDYLEPVLNQSQGGMCICRVLGIGPGGLQDPFGP